MSGVASLRSRSDGLATFGSVELDRNWSLRSCPYQCGNRMRIRTSVWWNQNQPTPLNDFNRHSEKSVEYSLKGINRLANDSE